MPNNIYITSYIRITMRLVIPESPIELADFSLDPLKEILERAPRSMLYEEDSDGFYIENDSIRFKYGRLTFEDREYFSLLFKKIQPRIEFSSTLPLESDTPIMLECTGIHIHEKSKRSIFREEPMKFWTPYDSLFFQGSKLLEAAWEKYPLPPHRLTNLLRRSS